MPVKFYLYPVPNKKNEYPIRVSISIGSARYMTDEQEKGYRHIDQEIALNTRLMYFDLLSMVNE